MLHETASHDTAALVGGGIHEPARWRCDWTIEKYNGDWTQTEILAGLAGVPEVEHVANNLLMTAGVTALWTLLIGGGGTTFANGNTYIGVGDGAPTALTGTGAVTNGSPTVTGTSTTFSTSLNVGDVVYFPGGDGIFYKVASIASNTSMTLTANYGGTTASGLTIQKITGEVASQTDLQASTNKLRVVMDASYPTISGNTITFRATFGSAAANFAWNEFAVFNASAAGLMLNRKVSAQGTKAAGATWVFTVTISIS